jgi:sec-independent protein translocase protein TatB
MFFGMGWAELLVCGLVAFFVFGPERMPAMARDAARLVRQLRQMAQGVSDDLKQHMPDKDGFGLEDFREVRDEFRDLRDLHPKRMVTRALFDDDASGLPATSTATLAASRTAHTRPDLAPGEVPPYDIDAT